MRRKHPGARRATVDASTRGARRASVSVYADSAADSSRFFYLYSDYAQALVLGVPLDEAKTETIAQRSTASPPEGPYVRVGIAAHDATLLGKFPGSV